MSSRQATNDLVHGPHENLNGCQLLLLFLILFLPDTHDPLLFRYTSCDLLFSAMISVCKTNANFTTMMELRILRLWTLGTSVLSTG